MKIQAIPLTEAMAKEISTWKYEGDYSLYNFPSWDEMVLNEWALCDAIKRQRFIGFMTESNELVGFVNLLDEGAHVFLGIGLKPNYCGMGLGKQIIQLAIKESHHRYLDKPIILEVRSWNQRAIKCYESQGFEVIEVKHQETYIGPGEFYVMKYS